MNVHLRVLVVAVVVSACQRPAAVEADAGSGVPCGQCEGVLCTDDDGPCGVGAHCDLGSCHANASDGTPCDEDSDCVSGHCANKVCCGAGDCCLSAADCPNASNPPRSCVTVASCQGQREDPICGLDFRCASQLSDDDSACGPATEATLCGLFISAFCDGGVDQQAPTCPTTCTSDQGCVPAAFCSATSACVADLPNGQACPRDDACQSGHCQNGFCCQTGDCCAQASDCPGFGTQVAVCDNPVTCQGSRGEAVCGSDSRCTSTGTAQDDSACATTTLSKDCGPYPAVFCDGGIDQAPPPCASTCLSNADCDPSAYCDLGAGTCTPDLGDGQACGTDSARCGSGHCQNGFCCQSGDCCAVPSDCPASYTGDAGCDVPSQCQGSRDVPTCTASRCGTAWGASDDSACTAAVVSSTCGPYPSAFCTGASVQSAAQCATSCGADADCDANGHCSAAMACVSDLGSGLACNRDAQCQSGHCQNGFCCSSGDCCAQASDCSAYAVPAVCDSIGTCQGHRVDGLCSGNQCGAANVDDDSACAGLEANACGPYPSVQCSAAQSQTTPSCATTCTDDSGCDASAHCTAMACVPDTGPGGYCNVASDCASGLFCVDNVCCTSACTGSCRACDLPGSVGTCTLVPAGQDPDAECPGVSCSSYYHSWQVDSCHRKADVSPALAACNGAGACRTQSQECTAQTALGSVAITCHATCQDPTAGTCTGTTVGTCTNVNPGTQSCGQGICARTVPLCTNGAPVTCVPGSPAGEICNDLDDNCDGSIDNGAFSDVYEPNGSCGGARTLGQAGSDQTVSYSTMTIFGAGDTDYYALPLLETDSTCGCGGLSFDEDYQISVTLTVPAGAGSYELCMITDTCTFPAGSCFTVSAGSSTTVSQFLDGQCAPGTTDSYTTYVVVRGKTSPGYECRPYTLSYTFDAGLCR